MPFYHSYISNEESLLYISSLYHDVGKFFQRTRDKSYSDKIKEKYSVIIGDENRDYIKHQEWSAFFLDEFLSDSMAGTMALKHHRPENTLQYLIAIGDKLSATERQETSITQNPKDEPLEGILPDIELNGRKGKKAYKRLNAKTAEPISVTMPVFTKEEALSGDSYSKLWHDFQQDLKCVSTLTLKHKLWTLTGLYEKYTSHIPSSAYYHKPTISLWIHSKLTTAIAFALYRQELDESHIKAIHQALLDQFGNRANPILNETHFCLVKGDISGIQDFVYDVPVDGAVRALRGRSFYISLLMEVIAKYILKKESLPITNILYIGGGHFYLLLPAQAMGRLDEYRLHCDKVLFNAHQGKLSVQLDGVELKLRDFGEDHFSQKWLEVGKKLQNLKGKKFWSYIQHCEDTIFGPFSSSQEVCPHCLRKIEHDVCVFCQSFIDLGEKLAKANCLNEEIIDIPESLARDYNCANDVFTSFGIRISLGDRLDKETVHSFAISEKRMDWSKYHGVSKVAAYFPVSSSGGLKDFDELSQEAKEVKLWGALRGDVDNLGRVFGEGLGEDRSISRVIALSDDFSHFFTHLLPEIISVSDYKNNTGIIYSGGDDFFIVGSWDVLPNVARLINDRFIEFAAFNPSLTVSMGIKLPADVKTPLYRVALDAGDALDTLAKENERLIGEDYKSKDSLAFMDTAIGWEEFPKFADLQSLITRTLEKGAPYSLLRILYQGASEEKISQEQGEYFKVWRLLYRLNALKERVGKDRREDLTRIQGMVIQKGNELYPYTSQAVRWSELLLRK